MFELFVFKLKLFLKNLPQVEKVFLIDMWVSEKQKFGLATKNNN